MLREHFSIRPSPNRACAFRSTRLSSVRRNADDPQDGFGASHLAYLPVWVSGHLPPFPMWTAFPSAEYYGGSVALRLAARRAIPHSRGAGRVERDGGASFAPLNGRMSHRPPRGGSSDDDFVALSRWPRRKTLCRGMYACIAGG